MVMQLAASCSKRLPLPDQQAPGTHLFGLQHLALKDVGDAVSHYLQPTGTVSQHNPIALHDHT